MGPISDTSIQSSISNFHVIGIGASAGGLSAFKRLLQSIPENSGMAFVLVQHLDPNHESLLPEILQKVTALPVSAISDDIKIAPNNIYVIPSNKMLVANDGVLQLLARSTDKKERNLPIDLFFTSLAEVHQSRAIGIVLSGTSIDGTAGLQAIKDFGGVTIAQDEVTAEYPGMPSNAARAGVVDFILQPEAIPQKLLEITRTIGISDEQLQNAPLPDEYVFRQILAFLRIKKGIDFAYYKQTTIRRRILRRMILNKADDAESYLVILRTNATEFELLFQDLLIPVTSFFRDKHVFDVMASHIFPQLISNKAAGQTTRIWVAGCSTGQEVYSLAICFREFAGEQIEKVQIFGTDLNERAIAKARSGYYEKAELDAVSPQRLQAFFTKSAGGYQLTKSIRDLCVFAHHNFLNDPPFGKMDMISCRNVLIYMDPYLQKKALTTFHYALNTGRFLLLGKSETTASATGLFVPIDKSDKLFLRQDVPARFIQVTSERSERMLSHGLPEESKNSTVPTNFQLAADEIVLREFAPAGVVVNENMDIVHFRGSTSAYLEQHPGKPTHQLLHLAKHGLAFELRNLLHKVKTGGVALKKDNIPLIINGAQRNVSIQAIPMQHTVQPHFLVLFQDTHPEPVMPTLPADNGNGKTNPSNRSEHELRIKLLEQESTQAREDMRSITQDQEALNEELQSANEELLSGSEELQSLNEELETSKEELQSTNEELTVLNQELMSLNIQASAARNYAESILATISQPLLVLDKTLRIKSGNSAFYKTFNLSQAETEKELIYNLAQRQWNIPELRELLELILPKQTRVRDFEVKQQFAGLGERIMLVNAVEIQRAIEEEKLILLTIEDITARRMIEDTRLQDHKNYSKELEEKVDQRALELKKSYELLLQKNEQLGRMNKDLEAFTYVSSHDLQEPLRKIQTFASFILQKEKDQLSETGKDYFQRMQDAAARMQQLIVDLLSFSRISNSKKAFEPTNLELLINHINTAFKEELQEKNASIAASGYCELNIIPFQFEQLFHNLISNSLKFARAGVSPDISIHAELLSREAALNLTLSEQKKYCHISYTDNGIGFDMKYKDQIFEVFQRLHARDTYPGTGIGLAIVKKIVENHHGLITADGKPGEGARFDIYIPAM